LLFQTAHLWVRITSLTGGGTNPMDISRRALLSTAVAAICVPSLSGCNTFVTTVLPDIETLVTGLEGLVTQALQDPTISNALGPAAANNIRQSITLLQQFLQSMVANGKVTFDFSKFVDAVVAIVIALDPVVGGFLSLAVQATKILLPIVEAGVGFAITAFAAQPRRPGTPAAAAAFVRPIPLSPDAARKILNGIAQARSGPVL